MSNYFPNARPLQSTLATMTALNASSYTCIGVFAILSGVTNSLKAEILTQYDNDPSDFPGYETAKDLEAALNKVEATFLFGGKYGFPALTGTKKIGTPTNGIMFYGNNDFQGLSIEGQCNVTLYIRQ